MHQHLHQFISAVNSFKDKEEIDLKELEKKCLECFTLVKILQKKKNLDDHEYELFRFCSTEIFLMCCPSIKENITFDPDSEICSVQEELCTINEELVLNVLRTLKGCKYLRGITCWLPLESNCVLLNVLMRSDSFTPAMLITLENLLYGIIFSAQHHDHELDKFIKIMKEVEIFLQRLELSTNFKTDLKTSSFLFHCLTTSLPYLLKFILYQPLQAYSQMGIFYDAKQMLESIHLHEKYKESAIKLVDVVFQICESFADNVSCNTFIEWQTFKTNLFDFPQDFLVKELRQENPPDNIQLHMGCNAYKILQYLNSEDFHHLKKFKKYDSLLQLIATVPEDNSASLLSLEQLTLEEDFSFPDQTIEFILKNNEIFSSEKCLSILQSNIRFSDINAVKTFLTNAIQWGQLEGASLSPEWKSVILEYAKQLPSEVLVKIIKKDLLNGSVAVLKQQNFSECMTKVFNQLDSSVNISKDFLHLALQSGVEAVSLMLNHAFDMPGLEHVLMQALENLTCICFSTDNEGNSVAATVLKNLLPKVNSDQTKNIFVNISSMFLKMYEEHSTTKEQNNELAFPNEILKNVVLCNLQCTSASIPLDCKAVVKIFVLIMEMFPKIVFCPRKEFSSSFVTLTLISNNFFCQSFTDSDDTRSDVTVILEAMIQRINLNRQAYREENAAINTILSKYDLHPRCCLLIRDNTPEKQFVPPTFCDEVLCQLYSKEPLSTADIHKLTKDKYKWSWALLQILPDADEREWIKALMATHFSIMRLLCYSKVIRTLDIFYLILKTACSEYEDLYPVKDIAGERKCIFARFSSAAITYIKEVMVDVVINERVVTVCNIGIWWCGRVASFSFDPELTTSLLSKLVNFLTEQVNQLKSNDDKNLKPEKEEGPRDDFSTDDDNRIDLPIEKFVNAFERIPSSGLKTTTVRKLELCLESCQQNLTNSY